MKNRFIKCGDLYLESYGPTKEENEWTPNTVTAFRMTQESAETRLVTVRKFYSSAEIVEAPTLRLRGRWDRKP
jgi:hypothetical protein